MNTLNWDKTYLRAIFDLAFEIHLKFYVLANNAIHVIDSIESK